jgi:shikimate kinase
MGTGKSSVGRIVAKRLGMNYLDLDDVIEEDAGKKISEIFAQYGEPHFRDLESDAVKKVSQYRNYVIATGGGVVLRESNLEALRKNGVLILLQASPDVIYERTRHEGHRPLLNTPDPLKRIKELLQSRRPYYKKCDFEIDTTKKTQEEVSDEIIEIFKEVKRKRGLR